MTFITFFASFFSAGGLATRILATSHRLSAAIKLVYILVYSSLPMTSYNKFTSSPPPKSRTPETVQAKATTSQVKDKTSAARIVTHTPEPTAPPKPLEKINIVVTSVMVKKVNGKYRYFFDVRNKDTKPFEGDVTVLLYNSLQKSELAGD